MSLYDEVNRVLDVRPDLLDPRDIARVVADEVPEAELRDALAGVLPHLVREVIRQRRGDNPYISGEHPESDMQAAAESEIEPPPRGVRRTNASAQQTAIRQKHLSVLVEGASGWMTLGDMTDVDLKYAIEFRRKMARAVDASADRFQVLLDLLAEHGVTRVRDLPNTVLDELAG